MKPRLSIVLLCLLAAGLGVALWQERSANASLAAQITRLSRQNAGLRYAATQAARQAETVSQRAVELDTQLGTAKSRTTATEIRHARLTRELTAREQREVALMAELATLKQKLAATSTPAETSRGDVAAAPTGARAPAGHGLGDGRTPPADPPAEPSIDVTVYQRRIAELEQQLIQLLTRALAESPAAPGDEPDAAPGAPAPYQVVRVGPRDSFVVLDFGSGDGARPGQIIGLWHGTSQVARVQISDARPRFSLAQVLSATLKGQLQTGDLVVLTN